MKDENVRQSIRDAIKWIEHAKSYYFERKDEEKFRASIKIAKKHLNDCIKHNLTEPI